MSHPEELGAGVCVVIYLVSRQHLGVTVGRMCGLGIDSLGGLSSLPAINSLPEG